MDHGAIVSVFEVDLYGVPDPDPEHGARHFAIKGPVSKCGPFGEPAFEFDRYEIHANGLRGSLTDRWRDIGSQM
jgi:hypothetical protein